MLNAAQSVNATRADGMTRDLITGAVSIRRTSSVAVARTGSHTGSLLDDAGRNDGSKRISNGAIQTARIATIVTGTNAKWSPKWKARSIVQHCVISFGMKESCYMAARVRSLIDRLAAMGV